jgi:hypothetical protein
MNRYAEHPAVVDSQGWTREAVRRSVLPCLLLNLAFGGAMAHHWHNQMTR